MRRHVQRVEYPGEGLGMSTAVAQLTTTALLEGLFDPANQELWRHFDERYRPVIIAFARRLGVEPTDAADIAQETLVQFLRDYREGKYDRNRGRLHCWIIGIAKHRIADQFRLRAGGGAGMRRMRRQRSGTGSLRCKKSFAIGSRFRLLALARAHDQVITA